MKIENTPIADVKIIIPTVFEDERGYFYEAYHQEKFAQAGLCDPFVQDNQSQSQQGTLRGLHMQVSPKAQAKLVRVLEGEIFDVCVDLRKNSPTYKQWFGLYLNAENKKNLYIPTDFAHGFYVTSKTATVLYKCTAPYAPECEKSLKWSDPDIAVNWPIPKGSTPIISEKDKQAPLLGELDL